MYVPPPDDESRAQILALELRKMPLNFMLPSYDEHTANNNDIQNKNKIKNGSKSENKDENDNENEKKKNVFDWHSSNPIVSATDLNLKLSNFSFSDNNDVAQTTHLISIDIDKDKDKDKDNENGNQKEVEVDVKECSVDEKNLLSEILIRTKGFSGAEMVAAVQEAGMLAIDSGAHALDLSHLFDAIHGIIPQITQDTLDFYEKIAAEY
jgi:SpoVK/Ycf46/Vps4 family AAA+-type ATPase